MKITLDYNSNRILINPDDRYQNSEVEYIKADMRNPVLLVENLLKEIFNRIEPVINSMHVQYSSLSIELEKLDEDKRIILGEW